MKRAPWRGPLRLSSKCGTPEDKSYYLSIARGLLTIADVLRMKTIVNVNMSMATRYESAAQIFSLLHNDGPLLKVRVLLRALIKVRWFRVWNLLRSLAKVWLGLWHLLRKLIFVTVVIGRVDNNRGWLRLRLWVRRWLRIRGGLRIRCWLGVWKRALLDVNLLL